MFVGSYCICFCSAGHQDACGYSRLVCALLVALQTYNVLRENFPEIKG